MTIKKLYLKALFPTTGIAQLLLIGFLALVFAGCSSPVGVDHVDIQTGYTLSTENAISEKKLSDASKIMLRRHGLLDRFTSEPQLVLTELHADIKLDDEELEDRLFTLAELSMLHAEQTDDQAYYLASAVYAWALLFPGNGSNLKLHPSDPRFRLAYDFYNRGIAEGMTNHAVDDAEDEVHIKPGDYALPFGTLHVTLDETGMTWGGYPLERFISTSKLDVYGLRNRYRSPGLGASMAASPGFDNVVSQVVGSERLGRFAKVPVSALLRMQNARDNLSSGNINGRLEIYPADGAAAVTIDGKQQPIEFDTTAALAYQLNDGRVYAMEISGFLSGGIFQGRIPKDRAQDGMFMLHPYKPGKIPIVLVHGTASSPARWAELINELEGDPRIRERFQIWAFLYDSGNPVPYSAGRLRTAMTNTLQELDPDGKDPALRRMVVVGHSQGGLLTKLTATDVGNRFWDMVSSKPLDEIKLSPETRTMLEQSLFFKPLPFVERVIFISTPHHGAMLAASELVTSLAARFVTLPTRMLSALAQAAEVSGEHKLDAILHRPPTAIDNMNPNSPGLKLLASIPVSPSVSAHSIIAVEGDDPKEEGDDGVVSYQSAHIDEAVSELVVRWNHSCQGQPETIEEVRRILLEHLGAH